MPAARQARAANPRYSAASIVARTLVTSGRTWSWTPRIASTVAVAKLAEAATASLLYAAARSVASRQARSGSSHRPVSMQAHCSADTVAPQLPRTPGARSRLRDSRSSLTATSDSSRSQAAAQSLAWPSTVPSAIRYRRGISSPRFPNGSVAAFSTSGTRRRGWPASPWAAAWIHEQACLSAVRSAGFERANSDAKRAPCRSMGG